MNISDGNCTTFLHRFYATKAGWDAAHGTGKDIATAIAAGTAKVASGFSGAIGLANLAGGTAIDNIDKSYYSEKTIQAITAAIKSLRATSKKRVMDGAAREITDYSYFEALNDLENFDNDCSLQRGIEQIAELANSASIDAEKKLDSDRTRNVSELQKDLEAARKDRDEAVRLRTEFQQQLINAKDDAQRRIFQDQIKELGEQVKRANDEVSRLRTSLPTSAQATGDKPLLPPQKTDSSNDTTVKPTATTRPPGEQAKSDTATTPQPR